MRTSYELICQRIDDAFDPRTCKRPTRGPPPTAGESMVWKYYCMERWEEERALAEIVNKLALDLNDGIGLNPMKSEKTAQVARRFVFCHWTLRLTSGIWARSRPAYPLFLASPDSPMIEFCRGKSRAGSKALLFDKIMRGAALKSVGGANAS